MQLLQRRGALTLGEAEMLVLHEAAMKVLGLFPGRIAGQCALMSAAYSIALETLGTQPGYVVAGSFYIGDKRIFGEEKEFDGKAVFSESNPDWNGHVWIVYGDYLADVSVFRTADAASPRLLSRHIAKQYGRGRGFCAWPMASMDPNDLRYVRNMCSRRIRSTR
jgi:hypothetical protein